MAEQESSSVPVLRFDGRSIELVTPWRWSYRLGGESGKGRTALTTHTVKSKYSSRPQRRGMARSGSSPQVPFGRLEPIQSHFYLGLPRHHRGAGNFSISYLAQRRFAPSA